MDQRPAHRRFGMEEDGIEKNFPSTYSTRETADLFLVLITHLLREGGRCAIVLPSSGAISGNRPSSARRSPPFKPSPALIMWKWTCSMPSLRR